MAVGLTGGGAVAKVEMVETEDESAVGSETECETFTTFEDGTVECLLSYGGSKSRRGQTQHVGEEMWLHYTVSRDYFTHDSTKFVEYEECNRTSCCAGGAT